MPKKKHPHKGHKKPVHLRVTGSAMLALCCGKTRQHVTSDPMKVTCRACGEAALRAVQDFEVAQAQEDAARRQEDALAGNQGPRWWEAQSDA